MAENRIPKRSEVTKKNTWATEDIFPSDAAWSAEHETLKALPGQCAAAAAYAAFAVAFALGSRRV